MGSFGKILFFAGSGEGHGDVGIIAKSFEFIGHFCECIIVTAADFEGCINKDVADIVVACDKAGKETVERVEIGNIVFIDIDKTNIVAEVKTKGCASFNGYYAAVAGFYCFVDAVDEIFGFAGAFEKSMENSRGI